MRSPPQIVRLAGRQVAVEDAGPESGFPVIVHHGGTRHLFPGAVRDAQASGLRMIGYDRPGQGNSTPQPGRVVADCADDVRAILADLGISRAAVWGSSAGGPYALATAALLPEAVASVCLFASLGPYGQPGLDFAEGMGDGFREEIRVFFGAPGRARADFQAQSAQFGAAGILARLVDGPVGRPRRQRRRPQPGLGRLPGSGQPRRVRSRRRRLVGRLERIISAVGF